MKDNKFYTLGEIEDKYIGKKGTPKRDKYEVDLQTDVHSHFIGEAIKQARLSKNMTQAELGSLTGVQRAQISRLEKGNSTITLPTLSRVFQALGIATATLDLGIAGKVALW